MSAPIVACTLADALTPILLEIERSIGASCSIDTMINSFNERFWVCYIRDHGTAFQGIGDSPSRAVMQANTKRQEFEEAVAAKVAA